MGDKKRWDEKSLFRPGPKTKDLQLCGGAESLETGRSENPHEEAEQTQPHQGPLHQCRAKQFLAKKGQKKETSIPFSLSIKKHGSRSQAPLRM